MATTRAVASRIAAAAIGGLVATISWEGEIEICEVEEVELGCGAACESQVWENKIQATVGEPQEAVIFTDGSRRGWQSSRGVVKGLLRGPASKRVEYLGEGATVMWDGRGAGERFTGSKGSYLGRLKGGHSGSKKGGKDGQS